jgi:ssDNA-binding Zn-finger/Zn-ribbon topoisomerase 1
VPPLPLSLAAHTPLASPMHPTTPLPVAAGYTPKVSFDTFENESASMFSYTLQVKSERYVRGRNTRVYLCAASRDTSGSQALDWALENLAQDGDELIVFRGIDQDDLGTFSPFIACSRCIQCIFHRQRPRSRKRGSPKSPPASASKERRS